MCFSEEASFTAAAVLTVVGMMTLRNTTSSSQWMLASIPLIFALQQLSEGFVWLLFSEPTQMDSLPFWKYFYLTIAFAVWPVWIPSSLVWVEQSISRRKWLYLLVTIGAMFSALMILNLYYRWPNDSIQVSTATHSLVYDIPTQQAKAYGFFYCLATLLPPFISSFPGIWVLAWINLAGFLISYFFFNLAFISVWCFFAALISLTLYWIFRTSQTRP